MFANTNKIFKIAFGLLMLAPILGIGFYYGVFIPQIEREKIEKVQQAQREKHQQVLREQEARRQQEQMLIEQKARKKEEQEQSLRDWEARVKRNTECVENAFRDGIYWADIHEVCPDTMFETQNPKPVVDE